MTQEHININELALRAGAAKFYPERQAEKDDAYLVGREFLEKFAALVVDHARATTAVVDHETLVRERQEPAAQWGNPRVQAVYELLCSDDTPPPEQHWEGWLARRIVDALEPGEPVAYLWRHSQTGSPRFVMPGQVVTTDAAWVVVGPLHLGAGV